VSLVKTVEMRVLADAGDAQAKLDQLDAKRKELDGNAIKMRFRVDDAAGQAQLDDLREKADKLGLKEVGIKVRVDGAGRAIAELTAATEEASKASEKAAAGSVKGEGGTKFWDGLKMVMLGVGVAAAYGIDKAMKFQSEMMLLHTQAGVSMKDTQAMSKGVLQISAQTGQSLSDVAEAAYHVASNMESMHASVPKQLDAVRIAAEGAAVGHSNLVDTTNAMTAAISANIPGVKNYSQAMGVLNATVGSGDMKMQDLAEAFGGGMVATVKGYGLSLKDVGAALATFGDNNIRGAVAGTDLRMAVQALSKQVKTAPLKEFGLQADTLAKDMQSGGLMKALDDMTARFHKAGLTGKTEGMAITELFGKKAGSGISVLLEQMDRLHSKYPQLTENANNFNKAWEATQATPQQKWKELTAGLQVAAVNFGTTLLPAFSTAVGWANKLLAAINDSKGGARDIAIALGGIGALFAANKLTSGIKEAFSTAESGIRGIGKIGSLLNIPGMDKLANLGKPAGGAAATGSLDAVAAAGDRAAAALNGVAGAGDKAAVGEGAAGARGGSLAGLAAGANVAGAGVAAGLIIKAIGDKLAPAGTQAGTYNAMLQHTPATNASSLMPSIFGGFEGKLMSSIGMPVGGAINSVIRGAETQFSGLKSAAQSSMSGVSSAVSSGMAKAASAAQSGVSQVVSAVASIAGKVKGSVASFGGLLAGAGRSLITGLVSGIESMAGAAVSAAEHVASSVVSAVTGFLHIRSPSKVMQTIGQQAVQGLVLGLEGGQAAVSAASQAIAASVVKPFTSSAITSSVGKLTGMVTGSKLGYDQKLLLTAILQQDNGKLQALAAQRQQLEQEITLSEQTATSEIQANSVMNAASLAQAAAQGTPATPVATSDVISGMQQQAAQVKAFTAAIKQLKAEGLNATSLSQIVQAGSASGLPVAQALLSGGKQSVTQVNQLESQIKSSAAQLGDAAAPAMYQAGVQAGQGLAAGIKSQLAAVQAAMKQLADSMVAEIKKDLKSHSPSLLMAEIGESIPQGVAVGISRAAHVAVGASAALAARTTQPWGGGSGGGARGGDLHVHFEAMVHTQDTARQVVQVLKEYKRHGGGAALGIA